MPFSALPPHLRDIEANFADDKQFGFGLFGRIYTWINQKTKTWFAFSYRCTEPWAKWREAPITLFRVGGEGQWRWETTTSGKTYLSRIQHYKTWSFIIQWPLMFTSHFFFRNKPFFFYYGHYDSDNIFWMVTSVFIGRTFK